MLKRIAGLALVLAVAVSAAGLACGQDDGVEESEIVGTSVTIYSSLPLRGPLAPVARDIVRAEKLALKEAGGRAGAFDVGYVSLNSADPETGRWDPGLVAANARKAVQDRQTIAYLGELDSGASAISLPILNEGGILQVSPRDTFAGLTERGGRGEPEKYYPSGRHTFARVVPSDDEQARQLVDLMRRSGVRRVVLADDRQLVGTSMGDRVADLAEPAGLEVVERLRLDPNRDVPDDLAEKVLAQRANAFFYAGAYNEFAVEVLRAVHAGAPAVRLFGTDHLAIAPELPARAGAAGSRLILGGVDPAAGDDVPVFERRFRAEYGRDPDPQAILGYRAMRLVLDAIEQAGEAASSRRAVIERTLQLAGEPQARFAWWRVDGDRLVRVRRPL